MDAQGSDISAEVTIGDTLLSINDTPVEQLSSIESALIGIAHTLVLLQLEEQETGRKYSINCKRNIPAPSRKVYMLRKEIVLPDLYVNRSVICFLLSYRV